MSTLHLLLPLVTVGSWVLLAGTAASRLLRDAAPSTRLAGTICLLYGIFSAAFQIFGLAGVFSLQVVVPAFVLPALAFAIWWRKQIVAEWNVACGDCRRELAALVAALRREPAVLAMVMVIAAYALVCVARALTIPRLGWDDFTYHVFRAGRWVQNGGLTIEPAPDAWSYYAFFPWGGDLIWAWALIWGAGDVFVGIASTAVWALCLPLAYGLARRFNQEPLPSFLTGLILVLLPSQFSQIVTAYVDNVQLMLVLACSLLLFDVLEVERAPSTRSRRTTAITTFFLGLSCGLGVLVKVTVAPLAAMCAFAVVSVSIRRREPLNLLAFAAGAAIVIPNLAFNWYQRRSPFYPFRVLDSLPFNDQLAEVLRQSQLPDTLPSGATALIALVVNVRPNDRFLNIGFAGALLILLGVMGALYLWSNSRARLYLLCIGVTAVVTVGQLLSPANTAMLTTWAPVLGRFVIPGLAPILLCAGRFSFLLRFLLLPIAIAECFLYGPRRWPGEIVLATGIVMVALLPIALAAALRSRFNVYRRWALAVSVVLSCFVIHNTQNRLRYEAYRLSASGQLDVFRRAYGLNAWPIWQRLERSPSARIAMAAGWDGLGHNWFRYPLLGSRLQNEVLYIPVTVDGSIVNYADRSKLLETADRHAWLSRLLDHQIEWVVLIRPATLEHQWIEELPDIFSIEMNLENGEWMLARVNSGNLSRRVRGQSP